jgi:N-acetylmuramoyl-L-alanine amidase
MDIGVNDIRKWHTAKGWIDVGYHYVIRRSGVVELGRRLHVIGSHVKGYNATSVGICLVGGLDKGSQPADNFTAGQKRSLRKLLVELSARFPGAKVVGHRDLSPDRNGDGKIDRTEWLKDCPCFDVRAWWGRPG